MAGKSSFLRTVGLALCMAGAGGVVDAEALTLSPLRVFTALRVDDSLEDGISFFYAEVKRLKALLTALETEERPLCFLIDEIFRGTNNRERLQGARAYVRALAAGRGLGWVATHDLELAALAHSLPTVQNWHFRDEVQDGRMTFDYRLRAGVCPTTNALKIMALEGLPLDVEH
jgi:DNA mismatch repair ATPase MutS